MKLRALEIDWRALPESIRPFLSKTQTFLTVGKPYDVYALSNYKGIAFALVVDDVETPVFVPSAVFEVIEGKMPGFWRCNIFNDPMLDLVIGPEFISSSLELYSAMIDQEPDQIAKFWAMVSRGNSQHEGE